MADCLIDRLKSLNPDVLVAAVGWGSNYSRRLAVKQRYDPDGLSFVRYGVGSDG